MKKIDDTFLTYACDVLAETNSGLSGMKIVEYCNSYAIDFNRIIPHSSYPFEAKNKRTALKDNLRVFEASEQFKIINELIDLLPVRSDDKVHKLRQLLYSRYGNLSSNKVSETELVQKTKHWLENYPASLRQYESALTKFESGIFERNTLDDMRLSFELLVKDLLSNDKSLENQISCLGSMLKSKGASKELKNMVLKIIDYYTKFQNNHVKHNDSVNSNEIEYVIELTSVVMKYILKINGGTK